MTFDRQMKSKWETRDHFDRLLGPRPRQSFVEERKSLFNGARSGFGTLFPENSTRYETCFFACKENPGDFWMESEKGGGKNDGTAIKRWIFPSCEPGPFPESGPLPGDFSTA
jgi:hypothetical protein